MNALEETIFRYIDAAGIVDTSIPAVVRATGLKAQRGENLQGFMIRIGHALQNFGFWRYRPMLQGDRAYRYARRHGATPRAHDPQLHPAEVAPGGSLAQRDPYTPVFAPRKRRASTPKPRPEAAPAREHVAVYVELGEALEWKADAAREGVSLSAYVLTIVRLARPHCPPGAVRAAARKGEK